MKPRTRRALAVAVGLSLVGGASALVLNAFNDNLVLFYTPTQLKESTFLMGAKWSWVDAAIAPFVRQFARTDRIWFDAQAWPSLQNWLTQFEHSENFSTVMYRYKIWYEGAKPVAFPPEVIS
jgi:hypothetical protein